MFEDSLVESGGRLKTRQGATTALSFVLEIIFLGILVLLPLIFTEALPRQQLMTFLVAPPPPPPPPPPPAAAPVIVKKIQSELVAPSRPSAPSSRKIAGSLCSLR